MTPHHTHTVTGQTAAAGHYVDRSQDGRLPPVKSLCERTALYSTVVDPVPHETPSSIPKLDRCPSDTFITGRPLESSHEDPQKARQSLC